MKRLKALPLAAEIYRKFGDESQVVQLHVEARDWAEAFRLAENLPQLLPSIHLQHAEWLADSDQFIAAHEAYIMAGKHQEASRLLRNLAECAVSEERYSDAGYYYWLQGKQLLSTMEREGNEIKSEELIFEFKKFLRLASTYYAYNTIHSYLREPFTSCPPLTLFNTSRFIANQVENDSPPNGCSMFAILYTLSKQAKVLGANKLHSQVNNKLQQLKVPIGIQDQVQVRRITNNLSNIFLNNYYFRLT